MSDMLWYTVNKTSLVRLVIVRDPDGGQPDDYFFTTDLHAGAALSLWLHALTGAGSPHLITECCST